jgi:hypothetical protein
MEDLSILGLTAVILYVIIGLPLVSFTYWVSPMLSGIAIGVSAIVGSLLAPIVLDKIKELRKKIK